MKLWLIMNSTLFSSNSSKVNTPLAMSTPLNGITLAGLFELYPRIFKARSGMYFPAYDSPAM